MDMDVDKDVDEDVDGMRRVRCDVVWYGLMEMGMQITSTILHITATPKRIYLLRSSSSIEITGDTFIDASTGLRL